MNRRKFIAATAATAALGALPLGSLAAPAAGAAGAAGRQYLEFRKYRLPIGPKRNMVSDFYRDVAIPALNRLGVGPIGVFTARFGPSDPTLYVLLPHASLESVVTTPARLLEDTEYVRNGADFLNASIAEAPYVRLESSLMLAFKDLPQVEPPSELFGMNSRIMELRTYESHSYDFGQRKIHMFNEGGELDIFREVKIRPVFFGETIIGPTMPNLTYMAAFESMEERDANWDQFRVHPDWVRLRAEPYYANTVSNSSISILVPTGFSQV